MLWLDTADLSDHGPIILLQVRLGRWPSFTGMEHGTPHARAVYMAAGIVTEVAGHENLAQGYKTFFMLNSSEHEIETANKI